MRSHSSSSSKSALARCCQRLRLNLTYYVRESGRDPVVRPWVSLVSLGAFLGMQSFPGVFMLQEVQAQEQRRTAAEQVELQKESAIMASRAAQMNEQRAAQRSRIKASEPTDCGVGDCQVTPKALDLSKPPTEKQLRMAGGMGGALSPVGPADVPVFADKYDKELKGLGVPAGLNGPVDDSVPGKLVKQRRDRLERLKKINLGFGKAMQDWNRHKYREAAVMLKEHVEEFPDSPWAGEALLHLGCDAKYNGRFAEAAEIYNDLLSKTSGGKDSKSFEIHQKSKLRWADLNIAMGKIDDAQAQLQDLVKTDTDWRRRTWAMHWLRMMGLYKKNSRTLRACGSEALGFMLVSSGQEKAGKKIAVLQPKRENGFTLAELQTLAQKHGVQTRGFRGRAADLRSLPKPLIIHYDFDKFGGRVPAQMNPAPDALSPAPRVAQDGKAKKNERNPFQLEHRSGHFLVVRGVDDAKKKVALFDPQERRAYSLTYAQLDREWSGTGLVRVTKTLPALKETKKQPVLTAQSHEHSKAPTRLAWLSLAEMKEVIGGCCGVARTPGDMGPNGPKGPDCGSPTWSINQVNLNMYLSDTPLWYKSPIGPSVNITMNYNSQDSTNQSVAFGNKWHFNYGSYVVEDTGDGGGQVTVFMPNSRQENFIPNGLGGYTNPIGSFTKLRHPSATRYEVVEQSGEVYVYDIPAGTGSLQPYLIQIRDPWGNALTFGYDAHVRLTTITDALGKVTNLEYDEFGHIIKATDPFGRFATFSYDQYGNMVEVVDLEGNAFQYTYDRDIYITQVNTAQGAYQFHNELPGREFTTPGFNESYYVTITNPLNQVTKYGWNGSNVNADASFMTAADGSTTTYHVSVMPDGKGRVTSVDLPKSDPNTPGRSQTTEIDPTNGLPRVVTDASGASTTFSYNPHGQISSVTDARGATTRFVFAPNGVDMIGVVDATGKRTSTSTYNDKHLITSLTDAEDKNIYFTYTSWGALKTVTTDEGSSTIYNYDETIGSPTRGLLLSTVKNGVTLASYQYDNQGRVTSSTGSDNKTVTYEYNDMDHATKVTLPDGSSRENEYSCCGVPTVKKARDGKKTYYDYDALNRLSRVQDTAGNTIQYSYYVNGKLKSITDSKGATTTWAYDELGRVISKGLVDGSVERYAYDEVNRSVSIMNAKGRVSTSYYDANGNLIRVDRPGTAADVTLSYDILNRPYQMKEALGVTTYGYDKLNRVTLIDGPWANDTLTYHYNNMGRRDWMRINGADEVSYSYDALQRMRTINSIAGQFAFNYVGNTGQINDILLPNNTKTNYSYDTLNRLTLVANRTSTNALISQYSYGYGDTDGQPGYENTSRRTYRDSQVGVEAVQRVNYGYSGVGELLSEVSNELPVPALNKSYSYDAMGNRQGLSSGTGIAQFNVTLTNNQLNQTTQGVSTPANGDPVSQVKLSYDALGNTTKMANSQGGVPTGTTQYGFTDQDELSSYVSYTSAGVPSHKTSYVYDGLGRKRITREFNWSTTTSEWVQLSEKRYIMDGLDVVQERDETNAVKTVYTRAGNIGGLMAKSKRTVGQPDVHLFYHYDGQGNVAQLTDATQQKVADYRYDAFGNSTSTTGTEAAGNLYRFSTKELQPFSGLYDYGLRFYSPGLGRFINRDPSGIAGGLNLYAAFNNNPISNVDAYGLSFMSFAKGFAVGFGVSLAVTLVMGAVAIAFPAVGAFLTAYGAYLGTAGVALAYKQYGDIINSNLCPDEKDYRLGLLCGGILGGMAGGKLTQFLPKKPPTSTPIKTRCFVAGTKVMMADGKKKSIEEIEAGDYVLTRNEKGGKIEKKRVVQTFVNLVSTTLALSFFNGERVETTGGHRFFVEGSGWKKAKNFVLGTSIVTRAGPSLKIKSVRERKHNNPVKVYNFEVEGTHTYFVSNSQLWAHNDTIELFRGVPSNSYHPNQYQLAQQGIVRPLGIERDVYAHRSGSTANSALTSWTRDWATAAEKALANGAPEGVVLVVDYEEGMVYHEFDPVVDGLENEFLLDDAEIKAKEVYKVTPENPYPFEPLECP